MPRGDGTGPAERGSGTGRDLGRRGGRGRMGGRGLEAGGNAYAQIVDIRLPINRVSSVMRLSVPNVGQQ